MKAYSAPTTSEEPIAGYAVLDDKGRLGLPKDLRQRLGVRTGGNFSYTLLDGMVRLHVATAPAAERDRAVRVSVDERGRITFLRPIRRALDAGPGSTLAYILLDDTLLLIPQDDQLRALIGRAERALAGTGARTHDLLDELPAIRDEVMREAYGDAFMDALAREHAGLHGHHEPE